MKTAATIAKFKATFAARNQRNWERATRRIIEHSAKTRGLTTEAVLSHLDPAVFVRNSTTPARRRLAINAACRLAKHL